MNKETQKNCLQVLAIFICKSSNVLEYCSVVIRSGRASTSNSPGPTKHRNKKLEHNASENQDFDQ